MSQVDSDITSITIDAPTINSGELIDLLSSQQYGIDSITSISYIPKFETADKFPNLNSILIENNLNSVLWELGIDSVDIMVNIESLDLKPFNGVFTNG